MVVCHYSNGNLVATLPRDTTWGRKSLCLASAFLGKVLPLPGKKLGSWKIFESNLAEVRFD